MILVITLSSLSCPPSSKIDDGENVCSTLRESVGEYVCGKSFHFTSTDILCNFERRSLCNSLLFTKLYDLICQA